MNKRFYPFTAFVVLVILSLACASPLGGAPTNSPDAVATVVALTMQALTPAEGGMTPGPQTGNTLLPHSLYYISNGSGGTKQIFRMEKDGKTVHQVTSESIDVGNFAVSPVDGRVAYVANNQLIVINPDGSTRTVL
ncbi:MAG: TolB family protein, partial [Byssovorax cruenta]